MFPYPGELLFKGFLPNKDNFQQLKKNNLKYRDVAPLSKQVMWVKEIIRLTKKCDNYSKI